MKKINTVVFISNFFNHHQKPFSDAMYEKIGNGYLFVETGTMSKERKNMGWAMEQLPPYVVPVNLLSRYFDIYKKKIDEADVVIIGSAPNKLVKQRIAANKLTFRYSERPLKRGLELWKYPYRFVKWHLLNPLKKNIYMLSASAYTAGDYALFGLFRNRCYKWGYFPKTVQYENVDQLIASKKENSLVWVARYLPLKHPEVPVEIARRLRAEGYTFELNMIGNGELMEKTRESVKALGLEDSVHILGAMKPEEVRRYMEQSQIFMFTSDRNEGWGAVLNESMNSGCAVVADRAIGSVPFLLKDGDNGLIYDTCDVDGLYERVKYLLDHPDEARKLGRRAYETITEEWNAETAAQRLLELCESLLKEQKSPDLYESGPCSRAMPVKRMECGTNN